MTKKADVIRVWFCEKCGAYEINFKVERLDCKLCEYEMTPRTYKQVLSGVKNV